MEHNWPGNVRELKNIIERLVIMTPSDVIAAEDIPPLIKGGQRRMPMTVLSADSFRAAKIEWEKNFILRKLQENEGNVSRTADSIGIERSNLHRKIKSYGLDPKKRLGVRPQGGRVFHSITGHPDRPFGDLLPSTIPPLSPDRPGRISWARIREIFPPGKCLPGSA